MKMEPQKTPSSPSYPGYELIRSGKVTLLASACLLASCEDKSSSASAPLPGTPPARLLGEVPEAPLTLGKIKVDPDTPPVKPGKARIMPSGDE